MSVACPFCDAVVAVVPGGAGASGDICPQCGRDRRQPRAPCGACTRMTPLGETNCAHCDAVQYRGSGRKAVAIIAMFIAAGAVSLAIRLGFG